MNILLIRPKPHKETIGLQHVMICEPLELEYLYSNIPCHLINKVKVHIIDMIIEKKSMDYFIKKYNPTLVAFTGYISHVNIIKNYAREIKFIKKDTYIAVGGVHAEVVPEDFLDDNIDFIIRANGIDTFNEIVESIVNNTSFNHIDGIYGPNKPVVKKMEFNYNFPNRKSVSKYRKHYYYMFHNPCSLIKTSFGCPYNCSFCFCKEITDGAYFKRPLSSVIDELKSIPEDEIYIVDDDFLADKNRIEDFCDRLEAENIKKNYLVYGRADFISSNEDLIRRFSSLGLRAVIVGIESFRETDLEKYNKKTNIHINERAIKILQKYDVETYATLILPLDYTKSDFKDLANWLIGLNLTFINLQPLTPLKGTAIYDDYKKDFIIDENEFEKWDLAHLVLRPKHLSIREFYMETIKTYYRVTMRPKNTMRLLKKYAFKENFKMFIGSSLVIMQYIKKVIRGV
ncbi:B12-binding domain-containing radical SAM protein [Anaeromicrobium sediminis]|uniref:B12-binding domain-containing radical SAM protein n=1 Tax=Anaeromicrobium sediminis TaxID=1478221 RepID=A0A267MKY4_9FIRM|nr:radical SAM protein [Anaeromicrobium sediminis]PAB60251.1 B12-binding domain-containing radical SAM protein [Anaeromicrobium sediminis]